MTTETQIPGFTDEDEDEEGREPEPEAKLPTGVTGIKLDPAVEAQIGKGDGVAAVVMEPTEPKPRGRRRRQARFAAAAEANQNSPVDAGVAALEPSPEPILGLTRNEMVDVLWSWYTNVGIKLRPEAGPTSEQDTDTMRCTECGQIFQSPAYAIRVRDGLPARCPNPAHGTKLYPAEFVLD